MAKLTLTDLASLTNETSAITTINNNNEAIETALENTLSRNGTSPNSMGAQLDMNTHKIINLAQGAGAGEALEYTQLQDYIDETAADRALIDASVAAASASATAAFNSAGAAAGSAEDAADILIEVQNIFDTYNNQYLGTFAGDPTVDNDGNPLTVGDIWYNSITLSMRVWDGTQAQDVATMTPTSTNTITNKIYQSAVFRNTFVPDTNDGAAIGTTSLKFSDLFLASGAVINFDSGDVTLTHSADTLTFAGLSNIVLPTSTRLSWDAGTYIYGDTSSGIIRYLSDNLGIQNNSAHVFYVDGAIRVTLNGAALYPSTSSPIALGDPAAPFSNLSLGSGSVINLNNGNVVLTHSTGDLTVSAGNLRVPTQSASDNSTKAASTAYADAAVTAIKTMDLVFVIGDGSNVLVSGVKGYLPVDFAGTIVSWTAISNISGSATIELWKKASAVPTSGDKITASAGPVLSSAQYANSSTLTGWTTSFSAGDVFAVNVSGSPASIKQMTISVKFVKA